MEKLISTMKTMLTEPFVGIRQGEVVNINTRCSKIAEELFSNYCVKCGNKYFRFAEIEFYYYKKEKSGANNFDAAWNKETYPRNADAGDFFFHYSGVDICFQSRFDDSKSEKGNEDLGEFGGILIRSLLDGDKILAGPLFCANAMLNVCKEHMPELVQAVPKTYVLEKTTRCGIASDNAQCEGGIDLHRTENEECVSTDNGQVKQNPLLLCYYASKVDKKTLDWTKTSEKITWDKKNEKQGVFKKTTRNYQNDRFKDVQ